jgi:predicted dehydrogenase
VASRSLSRAEAFAREFEVTTAYGSYAELVADPAVDVVYVASPHSEHREHALLAIEAGKPVLVEKAFARSAAEATEVVRAARAAGVFAMEAMWTRFLPHLDVVRRCLEDELLGDVHTVLADHGQHLYPDGPRRLRDPALAGGALLDLGIYPVSFAHLVLGGFASVSATGQLTELGVDAQDAIVVRGQGGGMGVLSTTMAAKTPTTASISGTAARLELTGSFYGPRSVVTLVASDGTELGRFASQDPAHGLHFQAAEVARRIAAGERESPLMPLDETVAILAALDDVRGQVGVRYPGE